MFYYANYGNYAFVSQRNIHYRSLLVNQRGKFLKKGNLLPPWLHTFVLHLTRFHKGKVLDQSRLLYYVPGSSIFRLQRILYIFTYLEEGIFLQTFFT